MNTHLIPAAAILAALSCALWCVPLSAADAAQPPTPTATPTKIVPFLGIATTGANAQQRLEASLPEGVGLGVQYVLPGSPAATAGLQRFDVLCRLDDQILINDPQFRVLVRTHRPGDEIRFTVVRDGQLISATVALGQREIPVADVPPDELVQWLIRPSQQPGVAVARAGFSASYEDEQHVLILTADQRGKVLVAKDTQGTTLFSGPVNTAAERGGLSGDVLAKLERLESPPKSAPKVIAPALLPQEESSPTE